MANTRLVSRWIALSIVLLVLPLEAFGQAFDVNTASLQVHVLNVGQGDATLVVGRGKTLLVDVGEDQRGGAKTHYKDVADAIRKYSGKTMVDYMVISHYHADHIGNQTVGAGNGLWGLLNSEGITIDTIIDRGDQIQFGPATGPHQHYIQSIRDWLAQGKVKKRDTAQLGTTQIKLGQGVIVEIVAVNSNGVLERVNQQRPQFFADCPPNENDYSIGLKISVGPFVYFTGGDLAGASTDRHFGSTCTSYNDVETELAMKVGKVEVMKVNHHGSSYSSNPVFVRTLAPEFAIVTSGEGNPYNHPGRDVMERLTPLAHVMITGGVSTTEWPGNQLLTGMEVLGGEAAIFVAPDGRSYRLQNGFFSTSTSQHNPGTFSELTRKKKVTHVPGVTE